MEYIRILTCKAMTTDEIWVRILIYNDCGTEKFLNVFFPVQSLPSGQTVHTFTRCLYSAVINLPGAVQVKRTAERVFSNVGL